MSSEEELVQESEDDSSPEPSPSKPPRIAPIPATPARTVPVVLVTPLPWVDRLIIQAAEAAVRPSSSSLEIEPRIEHTATSTASRSPKGNGVDRYLYNSTTGSLLIRLNFSLNPGNIIHRTSYFVLRYELPLTDLLA